MVPSDARSGQLWLRRDHGEVLAGADVAGHEAHTALQVLDRDLAKAQFGERGRNRGPKKVECSL